jgi:DNA-binding NtrC family response regulator
MNTSLFTAVDRAFAGALSRTTYCNPFLPERITHERAALGGEFVEADCDWNAHAASGGQHANIDRLRDRAGALARAARDRMSAGCRPGEQDLRMYEDVALFFLYHQYYDRLCALVDHAGSRVGFYRAFAADAARFLEIPGVRLPGGEAPAHLFAIFFQIRRAFGQIFHHIVGSSPAACRLRATAWESIFTHDLRRYRRSLFDRMGEITTLITGPSGSGKELVARAIGLSRYVPFNESTLAFAHDVAGSFCALSIPALSPTLIESELFGHRRGAFTGAIEDRAGWLETCGALGTVFLDEVGEIEPPVQVKLLRVLQTRTFQQLGDTRPRAFAGKLIAATNRDLPREIAAGRFREDFYYRLCSDLVTTPSLYELLGGSEGELAELVRFVARRIVGGEAEALTAEVLAWVERHLGRDYRWPGNFRELEQCVRNVLVRGKYRPAPAAERDDLARVLDAIDLPAEELVRRYCAVVYARTGSYEETARRVGLDRRTVKAKVNAPSGTLYCECPQTASPR